MKHLCVLFTILFIKISAQSEIKGIAVAENGQPIVRANVILFNAANEIETFGFSDKTGSFSVSTQKTGNFTLQLTAFNHQPKKVELLLNSGTKIVDLQSVEISKIPEHEIKEVVITRQNPVRMKKDTVEYTAEKLASGTEMNVEELLKKLPGITVESDGKIKFNNKEVERVMIEDDDLFERGYQSLTQNMPSQSLDKVQVLTNYSRNKLLKDVQNDERVAINLTLKEDAKGKWFGNALLASTSYMENMHQVKVNVMNFSKRRKLYFLYNRNNLGLNEMGGVAYLMNPAQETDAENIGSNLSINSVIQLHQKNSQFSDNRTNFNDDQLASLNYIYNFRNDWKLKFVTVYNDIENRNYTDNTYRFMYDGLQFTNIESKTWKQNIRNLVGKLELSREFSKNANLQFYSKTSSVHERNSNDFIFNGALNQQSGNNRLTSTESKISYTKKLDSSKALVAVARHYYYDRPYNFTDENEVFTYITGNPEARRIRHQLYSQLNFAGAKISYLNRYSDSKYLELQVGDEYRSEKLNSEIRLFSNDFEEINFNSAEFINRLYLKQNRIFAKGKFSHNYKNWKYTVDLLSEMVSSDFNRTLQSELFVSPGFHIGYEDRKTGSFTLYGNRRFTPLGIENLLQNYIYLGNRNFTEGTAGFQLLPDYSLGLSYSLGDQLTKNLNFSVNYMRLERFMSNNSLVNKNYTLNQTILVEDNDTFFANLEVRRYVRFVKSRFSLLGGFMSSGYKNSINGQELVESTFSNKKVGFEMKSGWTKKINYELGYDWTFSRLKSVSFTNDYLDQKGFFNLYYNFSSEFRIQGNFEYYHFGNTPQKSTHFLDIKADYMIKKLKTNVFLRANNLLNSSTIQRYSLTNVSESIYTQRLLPRHVVLGINKNF
ncbi:hypothetical protein P0M11_09510 [Kaistella sp. PBT33-4]|uniref:hypothetical protein n=1 Tax=Kaistella sp. PBT33-4 TaxID=3032000 RepID=UPI0023D8118A|nr:hypothetical protein [Kaistella sp. PBT33-4]MDF0720231.1 hypothetical protein [Kaistella sp. PBT33-4]